MQYIRIVASPPPSPRSSPPRLPSRSPLFLSLIRKEQGSKRQQQDITEGTLVYRSMWPGQAGIDLLPHSLCLTRNC